MENKKLIYNGDFKPFNDKYKKGDFRVMISIFKDIDMCKEQQLSKKALVFTRDAINRYLKNTEGQDLKDEYDEDVNYIIFEYIKKDAVFEEWLAENKDEVFKIIKEKEKKEMRLLRFGIKTTNKKQRGIKTVLNIKKKLNF